jgi:tRNA(Ile)-lysidine synthase
VTLLSRIERYAERHQLWRPDTRIVAAVSGGSDSVAMLVLLHDLHSRGALRLDVVAHLNHQLRTDAPGDEAFCRGVAERLRVDFVSAKVDVGALAREHRQSVELAGRVARHRFLDAVRRDRSADVIATAHTEDDQAETVLLRLTRGAGSRGLAGIAPYRGRRIRPVLAVSRAALRRDLVARGETWREDLTNTDLRHRRNRVRHELLPLLERHFNPSIRRALARTADILREEDATLARVAAAAAITVVEREDDAVRLDVAALSHLPDAIAQRVVMQAMSMASPLAPRQADVQRVLAVAAGRPAADLSVGRAEHFAGKVVLVTRRITRDPSRFCLELSVPGEVRGAGWILEAQGFDHPQGQVVRPDVAQIDAAAVRGGLLVRTRRAGDRVRPLGLGGTKKLQDVLVDRKVSRHERDAVPIVTDTEGRIVWVAGHVLGEEFRVTERTNGVIILKLRRI